MTTIPSSYLAKDYQAPSFNVFVKKENGNPEADK
jgi:hypothetical protein